MGCRCGGFVKEALPEHSAGGILRAGVLQTAPFTALNLAGDALAPQSSCAAGPAANLTLDMPCGLCQQGPFAKWHSLADSWPSKASSLQAFFVFFFAYRN